MVVDLLISSSSGEGEVVQAGDAEHGMCTLSPFEAAVAWTFRPFIRAKVCSTRARSYACERLCSSFHPGRASPSSGCGMTSRCPGSRRPRSSSWNRRLPSHRTPSRRHQCGSYWRSVEFPAARAQSGERDSPGRLRCHDHNSHCLSLPLPTILPLPERDAAAVHLLSHPLHEPAHARVGYHVHVVAVEVGSRSGFSSRITPHRERLPAGACLPAVGMSVQAAGADTALLSSYGPASDCGRPTIMRRSRRRCPYYSMRG
jgi:hypothetical protein